MTVVSENLAKSAIMAELDDDVAAVWEMVLGDECAWLRKRIGDFEVTEESVREIFESCPDTLREKAFRTIVKNRVSRGGILAPGAGIQKYGENGKGLSSRWYPTTLQKRIDGIQKIRSRMRFVEGDGLQVLKTYMNSSDTVFFIDPPYTVSGRRTGRRLYKHSDIDHERLFAMASQLNGNFLMTYDNSPEVQHLADGHRFDSLPIAMKNTHHAEVTELLISRDLDWAR